MTPRCRGPFEVGWRPSEVRNVSAEQVKRSIFLGFFQHAQLTVRAAGLLRQLLEQPTKLAELKLDVGSVTKLSAVRWGVASRMLLAWVLTIPCAGLIAALSFLLATQLGIPN